MQVGLNEGIWKNAKNVNVSIIGKDVKAELWEFWISEEYMKGWHTQTYMQNQFDNGSEYSERAELSLTSFGMLGVYQSKQRAYQSLLLVVHFMVYWSS